MNFHLRADETTISIHTQLWTDQYVYEGASANSEQMVCQDARRILLDWSSRCHEHEADLHHEKVSADHHKPKEVYAFADFHEFRLDFFPVIHVLL